MDEPAESVPGTVDIFADVDSARTEMVKHLFKGHHLLLGLVTAVIDEHVHARYCFAKSFPEFPICLVANVNRRVRIRVGLALVLYIHSMHLTSGTKIASPHRQTAAAIDTDLRNSYGT